MSIKLKEIIQIIENNIPLALQEEYDNCGLQTGDTSQEINSILISLDINSNIIDEAIEKQCQLVISHHPLIFSPLKKIIEGTDASNTLIKAIRNNIALYSIHTNLDNYYDGLNKYVAKRLGLVDIKILSPTDNFIRKLVTFCPVEHAEKVREALFNAGAGHIGNYDKCSFNVEGTGTFRPLEGTNPYSGHINETYHGKEIRIETVFPSYLENKILKALFESHPYEEVAYDIYNLKNKWEKAGSGISGILTSPLKQTDFIQLLKNVFKIPCIRHNELYDKNVTTVALCTGGGSFLIKNAINEKKDAFISADLKYHNFIEAENSILLADCGHFETEIFAREIIRDILIKNFPNFAIFISDKEKNPVNYS